MSLLTVNARSHSTVRHETISSIFNYIGNGTARAQSLLFQAAMRQALFLLLGIASLTACASTATTTPRIRVAQDLGCNAEQTTVTRMGDGPVARTSHTNQPLERWLVDGCGKKAVYLCTIPVRDCWREGDVHADSAAILPPRSP